MDRGVFEVGVISHVSWSVPFLQLIPGGGKALEFLQKFGAQTARQRMASGSNKRDLFHFLIDEDEIEPVKPKIEDVMADGLLAIVAGSDTSTIALSHTIYFMLQQPQYFTRLREEIDAAFPPGEDILNFTRLGELPYLNACLNEALRLYPPAIMGLQRRVDKGMGGKMIGPFYVPEETQVSAHLLSTQRDPRYFGPLPDTFWPDRWLSQDTYVLPSGSPITKDQLTTNKNVFHPFSMGPQNCAGKAIALMEMRAVLCAIVRNFDMVPAEGFRLESWEENLIDVYITHSGPLFVSLTARGRS